MIRTTRNENVRPLFFGRDFIEIDVNPTMIQLYLSCINHLCVFGLTATTDSKGSFGSKDD